LDNKALDIIDAWCNHEDVNNCRDVVALEIHGSPSWTVGCLAKHMKEL